MPKTYLLLSRRGQQRGERPMGVPPELQAGGDRAQFNDGRFQSVGGGIEIQRGIPAFTLVRHPGPHDGCGALRAATRSPTIWIAAAPLTVAFSLVTVRCIPGV